MRQPLPWLRKDNIEQLNWAMGYLNDRAHRLGPLGASARGMLIRPKEETGYGIYEQIKQWAEQASDDPRHKKLRERLSGAWSSQEYNRKKKRKTRSLVLQDSTKAELDQFACDRHMTADAALHALLLNGLNRAMELDRLLSEKVRAIETRQEKRAGRTNQLSESVGSLKGILQETAIDLAACQLQLEHAEDEGYERKSLPTEQVLKAGMRILKDAQERNKERLGRTHSAIRALSTLNESLVINRLGQQSDRKPHAKLRKRPQSLVNQARLRLPDASLEELDRDAQRGINLGQLDALAPCTWIQHGEQIAIIGAPGRGKTWLACAIARAACLKGFRARYYPLRMLLDELAKDAGSRHAGAFRTELLRQDLLIIDEFDPKGLSDQQYLWLLEVIDDRQARRSTLVASLKTPKEWAERIPDNQYAHMLVDRLGNTRYNFHLRGESRRLTTPDREFEYPKPDAQPASTSEAATRTCEPPPHTAANLADKASADTLTALTPEEFERRLKPPPEVEDLARRHQENLRRSDRDKQ